MQCGDDLIHKIAIRTQRKTSMTLQPQKKSNFIEQYLILSMKSETPNESLVILVAQCTFNVGIIRVGSMMPSQLFPWRREKYRRDAIGVC